MNEVITASIQPKESQFSNSLSTNAMEGQELPTTGKEPICWTYHFGIIDPKRLHSEQDWGLPSQYCKGPEVSDVSSANLQEQPDGVLGEVDASGSSQVAASTPALSNGSVTLSLTWTVVFLVSFVLKLTGTIEWPWIYVFAPVILQGVIVVAAFVSFGILYVIRNRMWSSAQGDASYSPL
jgi:hypothetical protein